MFGLPPPLIPKQLVSLSGDKRLLIHTYLLEFCTSLSIVASLPTAIQWALSEVVSLLRFEVPSSTFNPPPPSLHLTHTHTHTHTPPLSPQTNSQGVTHPQEVINLHHKLLELVAMNWQQRTKLGAAYSPDLQKVVRKPPTARNTEKTLFISEQPQEPGYSKCCIYPLLQCQSSWVF